MLEQLTYKNHLNETFEFGQNGVFVAANELHDFEWTVTKKGKRISALDYSVSKRKLPVTIICDTEESGIETRNRLFEIAEKDVLAMKHGRIIIGDYYFRCFVTKSQKKEYLQTKRLMKITLTLTTDYPYWVREAKYSFMPQSVARSAGKISDYPMDYPMDYFSVVANQELYNGGFVGTNFRLIIYGQCSNPVVYIGGHAYCVNCDVGGSEYLTIDSAAKTVTLTANDGTVTNKFNSRGRDSYIFQKIQPGANPVTWEGSFGFDIILLDERSEPEWT